MAVHSSSEIRLSAGSCSRRGKHAPRPAFRAREGSAMHGLSARSAIQSRFLERALRPRGTGASAHKNANPVCDTVPARARMRDTRSGRVGSRGLGQNLA